MNKEGYKDPTAEIAVQRASRMPKHIWNVFNKLNLRAGELQRSNGDQGQGDREEIQEVDSIGEKI